MPPPLLALLIVGSILLLAAAVAGGLRTPPEYGPDEIVRDPMDPTVITIARKGLVTHRFYEDGVQVVRGETFGLADTGIRLRLKDDPRDILMTTEEDWSKETQRFRLRPGLRLLLQVDGETVVEALRLQHPGRAEITRLFEIETAQGRFGFAQQSYGQYALLRGDLVVGIAAMPVLNGIGNRWTSRIELPGSLPLETRVFIALLIDLQDTDSG